MQRKFSGYETTSWAGLMAPSGTPKQIVDKVNAVLAKALATAEVGQRIMELGSESASGSPEQFGAFLSSEIVKWGQMAKESGARAD